MENEWDATGHNDRIKWLCRLHALHPGMYSTAVADGQGPLDSPVPRSRLLVRISMLYCQFTLFVGIHHLRAHVPLHSTLTSPSLLLNLCPNPHPHPHSSQRRNLPSPRARAPPRPPALATHPLAHHTRLPLHTRPLLAIHTPPPSYPHGTRTTRKSQIPVEMEGDSTRTVARRPRSRPCTRTPDPPHPYKSQAADLPMNVDEADVHAPRTRTAWRPTLVVVHHTGLPPPRSLPTRTRTRIHTGPR
ncbi:hypothetical protein B0H13DRAFT_2518426 [Mycena leptocephala]|nr:hypothetical protein B0H13DRAFT_2518426 [Mycena leptocephala]